MSLSGRVNESMGAFHKEINTIYEELNVITNKYGEDHAYLIIEKENKNKEIKLILNKERIEVYQNEFEKEIKYNINFKEKIYLKNNNKIEDSKEVFEVICTLIDQLSRNQAMIYIQEEKNGI